MIYNEREKKNKTKHELKIKNIVIIGTVQGVQGMLIRNAQYNVMMLGVPRDAK